MALRDHATSVVWLLIAVVVNIVAGCSRPHAPHVGPFDKDAPVVILISLDGFRWDYLDMHPAPNLNALTKEGVRARGLIPVFPTMTFPNHYSIVTGLYPEKHGIVSNAFYDPGLDRMFSHSDSEDAADSIWWGGEPIWVTAAKHGLVSAVYFWPGSETTIHGFRPDYWFQYDGSVPESERTDQALAWLDMRDGKRPSFIALYFSQVDETSHRHGPKSPETASAVRAVDASVGRLIAGLRERDILDAVNLIVVSDHGQAAREPSKVIYLEDYIDLSKVRFTEHGPSTNMWPTVPADELRDQLTGVHPHLSAYTRETTPERWRYRTSARISPLIAVVDEGWTFGSRTDDKAAWHTGGGHGYDPAVLSMHGIFVAHGPAFAGGTVVPEFQSVHLYALMCDILGIEPAPNQGSLSVTAATRAVAHSESLPQ